MTYSKVTLFLTNLCLKDVEHTVTSRKQDGMIDSLFRTQTVALKSNLIRSLWSKFGRGCNDTQSRVS